MLLRHPFRARRPVRLPRPPPLSLEDLVVHASSSDRVIILLLMSMTGALARPNDLIVTGWPWLAVGAGSVYRRGPLLGLVQERLELPIAATAAASGVFAGEPGPMAALVISSTSSPAVSASIVRPGEVGWLHTEYGILRVDRRHD
jgi:hypothetical protein